MKRVHVYSIGLVHASVCAPEELTPGEVAATVNEENPTGISSRWAVSDEAFADGMPNPNPCADHPGRVHYLLVC